MTKTSDANLHASRNLTISSSVLNGMPIISPYLIKIYLRIIALIP